MAAKRLTHAERAELRLKALKDVLNPKMAAAMGEFSRATPNRLGVLRAFRRLSKLADLSPSERNTLRGAFVTAFQQLLKDSPGKEPFRPADFGMTSHRQLADFFVTALERVGYAKRGVKDLRRIRSHVVGELLEVLVRNSTELDPHMRRMALGQIEILKSPKTMLLDAWGNAVTMPRDFGAPRKATDLSISGRGGRKKFIDYVHVSEAKAVDGTIVFAILLEVEIKMPVAAKKAGKQIGRAQARFHLRGGERLILEIEGLGRRELRADQIIFAQTSRDRFLVTIADTEQFTLRNTRRGGYAEAFWEVELDLKAASLKRLVDLAMP